MSVKIVSGSEAYTVQRDGTSRVLKGFGAAVSASVHEVLGIFDLVPRAGGVLSSEARICA